MSNDFKIVLVTTHLPLKDVAKAITKQKIVTAIQNAHNTGRYFGFDLENSKPKIAVCSLNPHAGDNGAIGVEEINLINPTIEEVRKNGIDVDGSFPADTIYTDKTYDFFIAMYHDQALIPIKLNSFGEAVNVTLGLNIIRTSVDHGTAFNIAGKGVASISSLIKAVDIAKIMITNKKVDSN